MLYDIGSTSYHVWTQIFYYHLKVGKQLKYGILLSKRTELKEGDFRGYREKMKEKEEEEFKKKIKRELEVKKEDV